jgi:hypothetical protein
VYFGEGEYHHENKELALGQTSTDDAAFTTVKQVTGFSSGTSDNTITVTNARYVRVVAVVPNGPNQPGTEMAISELEVYY